MRKISIIADNPTAGLGNFTINKKPVKIIATQEGKRKIKWWKNKIWYYYQAGSNFYYNRNPKKPYWNKVINNLSFWQKPKKKESIKFLHRNNIVLFNDLGQLKCQIEVTDYKFKLTDLQGNEIKEEEIDGGTFDIGQDRYPYKWEKKLLTWKLLNTTNELNAKKVERAVTIAFRSIGLHIPLKFRRERDTTKKTDVTIEFTHDLHVFNDKPSVIAQAYLFHPRSSRNGIVQFNDNHLFTIYGRTVTAKEYTLLTGKQVENPANMFKTIPLLHVLMHELYHMLGYRHDNVERDSIVWPYAKQGMILTTGKNGIIIKQTPNPKAFIWHVRDIARLHEGYGKRLLRFTLIQRMRERRLAMHDFKRLK